MSLKAKFGPLGIHADDRYRTIPEARIVEMLILVGWAYEAGSPAATAAVKEALQSWTQMGLGFRRDANDGRLFDPVEVSNFLKLAGLDDRDTFWRDRCVRTIRRLVLDLANTVSPSGAAGGERPFEVDFKRIFNLRSIAPNSRLRLRAALPLEGNHLRNLKVTPIAENVRDAQVNASTGRLEMRMIASGEEEVTLGAKLSFTASPQEPRPGLKHDLPDRALYLNRREGLIVVSERILELAQSLAKDNAAPLEAVRAFWDYINDNLISGFIHYDQVDFASPCDWVLDAGWYDCQLCSALFVALCRARGIPARIVGGYQLYQVVPAKHYWAEVWIEGQGWTPFDFLSWDLSHGGRDLEWRDHFFGRLDPRMITERLPREFTGALGIPIPPAWYILHVLKPPRVECSFLEISGTPVYTDTIHVAE